MPTLSSFLSTNFRGPQGLQGTQGLQGDLGLQGSQGNQGRQGTQGLQGTTGIAGDPSEIPQVSKSASYTLSISDVGKHISTTSEVIVPSSVFSVGDVISVFNNSAVSITITEGSSVTLRQSGTSNTGNRTLSSYGLCTILCIASDTFVISGTILT